MNELTPLQEKYGPTNYPLVHTELFGKADLATRAIGKLPKDAPADHFALNLPEDPECLTFEADFSNSDTIKAMEWLIAFTAPLAKQAFEDWPLHYGYYIINDRKGCYTMHIGWWKGESPKFISRFNAADSKGIIKTYPQWEYATH